MKKREKYANIKDIKIELNMSLFKSFLNILLIKFINSNIETTPMINNEYRNIDWKKKFNNNKNIKKMDVKALFLKLSEII